MSDRCCIRCKTAKPLSEFGRNKANPDGINSYCKPCIREKTQLWRETEIGRAYTQRDNRSPEGRERKRRYRHTPHGRAVCAAAVRANEQTEVGRERRREITKRYRAAHPERAAAHVAIRLAIEAGRMPSASECLCCRCGLGAHEYHHYAGYEGANALVVAPVCKQCHMAYERIQKSLAA